MNVRLFIAEIEKRRALWDQQDENYHNKKVLAELWEEIADVFGIQGNHFYFIKRKTSNSGVTEVFFFYFTSRQ